MSADLDELIPFATYRQREFIEAVQRAGGNISQAERDMGVSQGLIARAIRTVKRFAATRGYSPEHDMIHIVPDPFVVKGVSTYYDADGVPRGQWVKTREDHNVVAETVRQFVEELCESVRGKYEPTPAPEIDQDDLLTVYKFGDPHFGMASTVLNGGDDFDIDEADRLTRGGIDRLVAVTPASRACIVEVIGDVMHANDSSALTPGHKNPLDVDGRGFNHALLRAARAWCYVVERALEKHAEVTLWMLPGNHDPDASQALAIAVAMYFDREPRVKIDLTAPAFTYHRFGKVLLGAHHGDKVKMADLPLLMAVDRPEDWGATVYRHISTGHIHHDVVKEVQGVRVESLRTLAAKDPYHALKGYRSLRDTRAAVYHREFGEVERYTVSAAMIGAK